MGDYLLLKSPADYKGGFWVSYESNNNCHIVAATESREISLTGARGDQGRMHVTLQYTPADRERPLLTMDIDLWSHNMPAMLIRHTTTNVSSEPVSTVKTFAFMDYDIGGPSSYNDDTAEYDRTTNTGLVYDDDGIMVGMQSRPAPDGWDVAPPAKLNVQPDSCDLRNNDRLGPRDVAIGLQWNLGRLLPAESRTVEVAVAAGRGIERVMEVLAESWNQLIRAFR